ncbi:serine/threonine protein kinase [Nocardiopsis sp. Huas11]|uniref:serine/threonine-protein kinase n=1 Tax=Nocardiopsis sp. Huas11 TaxID=2183912 RepID=UPI000F1DE76A|nr:serine/threonine-protein kinase [Nocardiopsis sp. Huas11]RKS05530.1 serine/threonine protein kinase [Nocardiopsis sp. Huas11]
MSVPPSPMEPQSPVLEGVPPLEAGDPRYVGPFRTVGRLGSGGMGVVYAALDDGDAPAAVKRVHHTFATDTEFRTRFAREVDLVRRVRAACVPRFLDADTRADVPWLATEYVPGRTLGHHVRERGPLTGDALTAFALGVAEALAAIHAQGVVHRDLKPGNVILALDGPKVLDFGIARAVEETALTRTGGLVGTPGWMAPEQYRQEPVTDRSDVFSWAGLVAYAATGRGPFGSGTSGVLAARIISEPPSLEGVPADLRGLLERALAKAPEPRPAARELRDSLTLALAPGGGPDAEPTAVMGVAWTGVADRAATPRGWTAHAAPRRPWVVRRRRPLAVAAGALILGLVAGVGLPALLGEEADGAGAGEPGAAGDSTSVEGAAGEGATGEGAAGEGATSEATGGSVADDVPEEYRDLYENGRVEVTPVSGTELISTLVPASGMGGERLEHLRITFEESVVITNEPPVPEFSTRVEYLPDFGEARVHTNDFARASGPTTDEEPLPIDRPGSAGVLAEVGPNERTAEFTVTFFGYPAAGVVYYMPQRAMEDGRAEPGYPGGACYEMVDGPPGPDPRGLELTPYDATAAGGVPADGCAWSADSQ